jgi:prephenate dehydrogenase
MPQNRLSIIGVGLLGGSLGLAVRSAGIPYQIIGYAHRDSTRQRALEIGAIEEACSSIQQAVAGADLVVLCTPVGLFGQNLAEMAEHLKPGSIVTDVGSTKRSVLRDAERLLPGHTRFVASHPLAGSEKRGVEFARADLFRGARCIVTPTDRTDPQALASVEGLWKALGMSVSRMSAEEHDRLVCDISHLPHALAAMLVAMQDEPALLLAGKGFLDTTRIASGDGGLWRDILLDNSDNLRASIEQFRDELDRLLERLGPGKGEQLKAWLDAAADRRERLAQFKLRELNQD